MNCDDPAPRVINVAATIPEVVSESNLADVNFPLPVGAVPLLQLSSCYRVVDFRGVWLLDDPCCRCWMCRGNQATIPFVIQNVRCDNKTFSCKVLSRCLGQSARNPDNLCQADYDEMMSKKKAKKKKLTYRLVIDLLLEDGRVLSATTNDFKIYARRHTNKKRARSEEEDEYAEFIRLQKKFRPELPLVSSKPQEDPLTVCSGSQSTDNSEDSLGVFPQTETSETPDDGMATEDDGFSQFVRDCCPSLE